MYYVSTLFMSHNIFTIFLSIFFSLCIKFLNYSMEISSKCNVEKEIIFFLTKKNPSFSEKLGSQIEFCAVEVLT